MSIRVENKNVNDMFVKTLKNNKIINRNQENELTNYTQKN